MDLENQSHSSSLFCAPRIQYGSAKTLTPKPRTVVPQACYKKQHALRYLPCTLGT